MFLAVTSVLAQILEFFTRFEWLDLLLVPWNGFRQEFEASLTLKALDLVYEFTYLCLAVFLASDAAQVLQNYLRLLSEVVIGPDELDHRVWKKLLTTFKAVFGKCDYQHLSLLDGNCGLNFLRAGREYHSEQLEHKRLISKVLWHAEIFSHELSYLLQVFVIIPVLICRMWPASIKLMANVFSEAP